MNPITTHTLAALGGVAVTLAVVLYPAIRSAWQQRNEPAPLAKWSGGRMPAWPKSLDGLPECREPVGPSLPTAMAAPTAEVVAIRRPRGAA